MSSDRKKLAELWRELGIYWVDETPNADDHRRGFCLPEGLKVGAIYWIVGGAYYFFDAAGDYVGYGSAGDNDDFTERGRKEFSPLRYDPEEDAYRVQLEGRYVGVPKVHELSDEAGTLLHFREMPDAFEGGRFDGPGDFEEGDVLRVPLEGETADYEVTRAEPTPDKEGWELDARRIEENAKEDA